MMLELLNHPIQIAEEVTMSAALFRLGFTFILVFLLALTYRRLHQSKDNCYVMMHSMIYIGVILTGAMMVIGSNLVVAFGLLGAVSIIRFRTVVENPVDMSYIFLAIVVGISSGLGLWTHALVLTAFVAALMLILNRVQFGMRQKATNVYRINVSASRSVLNPETIKAIMEKMGPDVYFNVLGTSSKSVKIQFIKPLTDLSEVNTIHDEIVGVVGEEKSLTIRIAKK